MNAIGIIGEGEQAAVRARAAEALGLAVHRVDAVPDFAEAVAGDLRGAPEAWLADFFEAVDAVFIAVPTAQHYQVAAAAARQGTPLFLEWPPATSTREGAAIVRLAEEAGVEAGISRPLRYHPALTDAEGRAHLIVLRREVEDAQVPWPYLLADAVDVGCVLAGSGSVQRVDAEAVRSESALPHAVAFGLRFHNGAYAQVSLRQSAPAPAHALYAAGSGFTLDTDLDVGIVDVMLAETRAFLQALDAGRPAPASLHDGLRTMQLVERLMERLR